MSLEEKIKQTYEDVHYESYPFSGTSPAILRSRGILFGMNPPAVETARVLELGCSFGRNITPLAVKYPKAKFVGVDIAASQIEKGLAEIKPLGLKNIELKAMSITDINKDFGEFDYIICHGVFSWVPKNVSDKILEISKQNLAKDGIAYISYNTLPGWNMNRTIRDMMRYHADNFQQPAQKTQQARLLLELMQESTSQDNSPYSKLLKESIEELSQKRDDYIMHEHLEETNTQYYFHDFVSMASQHQLQYLSEVSVASMFLGNLPKEATEKLQGINDIIRLEQYIDFIRNRRFRSTLLCHNGQKLNRDLKPDSLKNLPFIINISSEKILSKKELNSGESFKFKINEVAITSNSTILTCALNILAKHSDHPILLSTLAKKTGALLEQKISIENLSNIIGHEILKLAMKGFVEFSALPQTKAPANLHKPKLSKIALHQASIGSLTWVTNNRHGIFETSSVEKIILKYMDGTNTKANIIAKLKKDVETGVINVKKEEAKIEDETQIKAILEELYDELLARAVKSHILEEELA